MAGDDFSARHAVGRWVFGQHATLAIGECVSCAQHLAMMLFGSCSPWLPLDAALAPMVVGLPPLVGGVAVRSLVNLGRLDRAFSWLGRPSRWLMRATIPLGLLVMAVPRPQLPLLSGIEELGLLGF